MAKEVQPVHSARREREERALSAPQVLKEKKDPKAKTERKETPEKLVSQDPPERLEHPVHLVLRVHVAKKDQSDPLARLENLDSPV